MRLRIQKATVFLLALVISLLWAGIIIHLSNQLQTTISAPYKSHMTHEWTKQDSLAYAHDRVLVNAEAQFSCLSNLWGKESAWNPKAHNPVKVMGKTAGGIPQILGMSPLTPPTEQIDRGLAYIYFRYYTACQAYKHWRKVGWY